MAALLLPWLAGLVGLVGLAGCSGAAQGDAVRLAEADLWIGRSATPPDETRVGPEGWQRVDLPDNWHGARRQIALEGWYRFERHLERTPGLLQGVYLPRASLNAQIFVNGVLVGQGGRVEPRITRNALHATYAPVPHRLLRKGRNVIDVRLVMTYGSPAGLDPIWVGPDRELRPSYERSRLLSLNAPQVGHALAVLVALLSLARATDRRQPIRGIGLVGGALLAFSGTSLGILFPDAPIPPFLLEWLTATCLVLSATLLALGMRRAAGRRRRWLEVGSLLVAGVYSVTLLVIPYERFVPVSYLGLIPMGVMGADAMIGACFAMFQGTLKPRLPLAILLFGGLTLLIVDALLGPTSLHGFRIGSFLWVLASLCLAWFVLQRMLQAMGQADELDVVVRAQREREEAFARISALERDRAVAEERERIMRDMHDGTAGQLVSAISLARSGSPDPLQLAGILQEALDDLRMTIEALDPADNTLGAVLGLARAPIERRLEQQGVTLEWRVGDIDHVVGLSSTDARNVLRLIQEAVANAIRHARATKVRISAERAARPGFVVVSVSDDGQGGVLAREGGRGLHNMQLRARELGGELELASDDGGTRVSFELPEQRPVPGEPSKPSLQG